MRSFVASLTRSDLANHFFGIYAAFPAGDAVFDDPGHVREFDTLFSKIETKIPVEVNLVRVINSKNVNHPDDVDEDHLQQDLAKSWSDLANIAYWDDCDYFYLLQDTTKLVTRDWLQPFINSLKSQSVVSNVGVVFPLDLSQPAFPSFSFFHRTHLEIFGTLFPSRFQNRFGGKWLELSYWTINANATRRDILVEGLASRQPAGTFEIEPLFALNQQLKQSCSAIRDSLLVWLGKPAVSSLVSEMQVVDPPEVEALRTRVVEGLIVEWSSPTEPEWNLNKTLSSSSDPDRDSFPCAQVKVEWREGLELTIFHKRLGDLDDNQLEREKNLSFMSFTLWEDGHDRRSHLFKYASQVLDSSEFIQKRRWDEGSFDRTIIITFTNWGHMKMTEHWILHMDLRGYDNYIVFAFDQKSFDHLKAKGANVFFHDTLQATSETQQFKKGSYKSLVDKKPMITLDLLHGGFDVLTIDNDIVVLKDMFPFLKSPKHNFFSQNGALMAGRVMYCGGYIFSRRSPETIILFTDVILIAANTPEHDQKVINSVSSWGYKNLIKPLVLPEKLFPNGRVYFLDQQPQTTQDTPVIVHNNFLLGLESKIHRFRENFLWLSDPDSYFFLEATPSLPSAKLLALERAEKKAPGSFLVTRLDHKMGDDEEGEGYDWVQVSTEKHMEKEEEKEKKLSKSNQLISKMILTLAQKPPKTTGKLVYFTPSDPSIKSLQAQQTELITAFMVAKALNRTLILPRMKPFRFKKNFPNVDWYTAEYLYEIDRFVEADLQFREHSYLTNPRITNKIEGSPLAHVVVVDLATSTKPPFKKPVGSVFDPSVRAFFVVSEAIEIKNESLEDDGLFSVETIEKRLGAGSPFSEVPFLVFTALSGRVLVDLTSTEYLALLEVLALRQTPITSV